jgi:hypothetical protein
MGACCFVTAQPDKVVTAKYSNIQKLYSKIANYSNE